jgi:hypothetical protein
MYRRLGLEGLRAASEPLPPPPPGPPFARGVALPLLMLSMLVLMVGSGLVGPSSTPQSGWYLLGRLTCV